MQTAPKIIVLGVGNILLSDEGIGVHMIKELEKESLPENVELIEAGTAGLELAHLIEDADFLIIIDAVNAKASPGQLFRFQPKDITIMPEQFQVSFHQVGILEALSIINLFGNSPPTMIYGVQPKSLEWGLDLTPELAAVVPKIKEYILKEIEHLNKNRQFMPLDAEYAQQE